MVLTADCYGNWCDGNSFCKYLRLRSFFTDLVSCGEEYQWVFPSLACRCGKRKKYRLHQAAQDRSQRITLLLQKVKQFSCLQCSYGGPWLDELISAKGPIPQKFRYLKLMVVFRHYFYHYFTQISVLSTNMHLSLLTHTFEKIGYCLSD